MNLINIMEFKEEKNYILKTIDKIKHLNFLKLKFLISKYETCLKLRNADFFFRERKVKSLLMQVSVSDLTIFRKMGQIAVHTHLSDPDPEPLLLSEEELSLLLSFSESDSDSLPDSDSNVFWKLIISTTLQFRSYLYARYRLSLVLFGIVRFHPQ